MAAPRTPQDHQPKAPVDGAHVIELDGHEWRIEEESLDDFELLDDLAEIEAGNAVRAPRVLRRLLGEDQYKAMLDTLRDPETGKVTTTAAGKFLTDLFGALPQGN